MKSRTAILTVLLAAAVAAVAVRGGADDPATPAATAPRGVRTATVAAAGAPPVSFPGVTRAVRRSSVAMLDGGRLVARPVEPGDEVTTGDVLARVDTRDRRHAVDALVARRAEAVARRHQSALELERVSSLHDDGAATAEEMEAVQATADALEATVTAIDAELADARRRLDEGTLRAPWPAMVVEVLAEPGEIVAPGQPVLILAGDGPVEIEIRVPEGMVELFHPDQTVRVDLPMSKRPSRPGRVESVARSSAGAGSLFPVIVRPDEKPPLASGLAVEVVLEQAGPAPSRTVPLAAIRRDVDGGTRVLVIDDGRIREVPVTAGRLLGGRIEIEGAVRNGEAVVTEGPRDLQPGDPVEVLP